MNQSLSGTTILVIGGAKHLGLAIAREIVRAHGGEIWATSEVGKGTAFHFTLPVARPGARAAAQR